jgi:hypothetical protein
MYTLAGFSVLGSMVRGEHWDVCVWRPVLSDVVVAGVMCVLCFEAIKLFRSVEMQYISVTHNVVDILHDPQPDLFSQIQFLQSGLSFRERYTDLCCYIQNFLLILKRGLLDAKIYKPFW